MQELFLLSQLILGKPLEVVVGADGEEAMQHRWMSVESEPLTHAPYLYMPDLLQPDLWYTVST